MKCEKISIIGSTCYFAGACQSHFEALIRAGANFASSPSRINIHALDPVYVVGKISFTSFMRESMYGMSYVIQLLVKRD